MSNSTPRAALPPLPFPRATVFQAHGLWDEGEYFDRAQAEQIRKETLEACAQVCAHLSTRAGTADECEAAILALLPVKEPKE